MPELSPPGASNLRNIFLKTDNHLKGRYFAEVTRELFDDLKESKYQNTEYRISIHAHYRERRLFTPSICEQVPHLHLRPRAVRAGHTLSPLLMPWAISEPLPAGPSGTNPNPHPNPNPNPNPSPPLQVRVGLARRVDRRPRALLEQQPVGHPGAGVYRGAPDLVSQPEHSRDVAEVQQPPGHPVARPPEVARGCPRLPEIAAGSTGRAPRHAPPTPPSLPPAVCRCRGCTACTTRRGCCPTSRPSSRTSSSRSSRSPSTRRATRSCT